MKRLILITGLLVALSGLIRSVDAQTTSIVGYGSDSSNRIHLIDLETATLIESFDVGVALQGLAIDPSEPSGDTLYGSDQNGELYRIDLTAATPTALNIGNPGLGGIEAMDFNSSGTELWVTDFNVNPAKIYKISRFDTAGPGSPITPADAVLVQTLNPAPLNGVVRAMASDITKDVWIANDGIPVMDFQSVSTALDANNEPVSPNVTPIGGLDDNTNPFDFFPPNPSIRGMDRDINGVLYGLSNEGGAYIINQEPRVPNGGNLDETTTPRLTPVDPANPGNIIIVDETGSEIKWLALAISTAVSPGPGNDNQPPVADAGVNVTIDSSQQLSTILNGTASDPDVDDSLTYRWLEGATELLVSTSVVGGDASLDLNTLSLFSLGAHTLTLEVSDGQAIATDDMILTIDNSPPCVAPTGAGIFQLGDNITLSGQVSDFDGDLLVYKWFECANEFTTVSGFPTTVGGTPVDLDDHLIIGGLPLGNHVITLEANDGINASVSENISIEVIDTTAATVSVTADPCILWPPNHKMVDVIFQVDATDNSGDPVTLSATVESSEPPDSTGDGSTIPDFTEPVIDQNTGVITLQLRSERKGNGSGRTYTITVTATDSSGNISTATIQCLAPHDMGKK